MQAYSLQCKDFTQNTLGKDLLIYSMSESGEIAEAVNEIDIISDIENYMIEYLMQKGFILKRKQSEFELLSLESIRPLLIEQLEELIFNFCLAKVSTHKSEPLIKNPNEFFCCYWE